MDTQDITIRDSMYLQVKTDLRDIQISLDDTLLPSWPPSSSFTDLLPHLNEISILWMGIPSKARIASAAKILIKLLEQVQEVRILKALKNMLDNSKDIVLSTPTQSRYLRRQTEIKQAIEAVLKLLEQPEILHDLKALKELFGLLTNPEAVIDVIKRLEEIEDILAASSWIEWLVNTENIETSYLSLYTSELLLFYKIWERIIITRKRIIAFNVSAHIKKKKHRQKQKTCAPPITSRSSLDDSSFDTVAFLLTVNFVVKKRGVLCPKQLYNMKTN